MLRNHIDTCFYKFVLKFDHKLGNGHPGYRSTLGFKVALVARAAVFFFSRSEMRIQRTIVFNIELLTFSLVVESWWGNLSQQTLIFIDTNVNRLGTKPLPHSNIMFSALKIQSLSPPGVKSVFSHWRAHPVWTCRLFLYTYWHHVYESTTARQGLFRWWARNLQTDRVECAKCYLPVPNMAEFRAGVSPHTSVCKASLCA